MIKYGGIRKLAEDNFILDVQNFADNKFSIKSTTKSIKFSSEKEARDFAKKNSIELRYVRSKDRD